MWQRIYALIVKELLASARDPQTRWVVLFSPPFLLLIYAFAITQEVSDVTLAVYNQDHGNASVELLSRFEDAGPCLSARRQGVPEGHQVSPLLRSVVGRRHGLER